MSEVKKARRPGSGRPKKGKEKPTLEGWYNQVVHSRERIVLSQLEAAFQRVKDIRGVLYSRIVLEMFHIKALEDLPIARYNEFLIVCKTECQIGNPKQI